MDTWIWVAVIAAAVVVVMALAVAVSRRRRSAHLRERFGPEYDHAVGQSARRSQAERELAERERHRAELEIRPLPSAARERYVADWAAAERRFVDDPQSAVREADRILRAALDQRGYRVDDDPDRVASDVSVDYPQLVQRYRHGHDMLAAHDAGGDGTEDLRKAMIDFRAVFEEVVEAEGEAAAPVR
jgi:hypothetical protein